MRYQGDPSSDKGKFSLEDTDAVLAYLRTQEVTAKLGVDPNHLVLVGHSMGGWIAEHTLAHDKGLIGAALISPADLALIGKQSRDAALAFVTDDRETIAETTTEDLADELVAHADDWQMAAAAPKLKDRRLLVLYGNDAYKPHALVLIDALKAGKAKTLTVGHTATDHAWSDHRIALQAQVINWLETLPAK